MTSYRPGDLVAVYNVSVETEFGKTRTYFICLSSELWLVMVPGRCPKIRRNDERTWTPFKSALCLDDDVCIDHLGNVVAG